MKVTLKEHKVPKQTRYGKVERSLNQYYVFVQTEDMPKPLHAGYIGMQEGAKFQPLCGFPNELAKDVCAGIQEWLAEHKDQFDSRPDATEAQPIQAVEAPLSDDQINDLQNSRFLEDEDE